MNHHETAPIYEQEGGVLAIELPDENIEHHLRTNEKIVTAFGACGMSPDLAIRLFLRSGTLPATAEEDQFTKSDPPLRTEHVVTKLVPVDDKTVSVLDIDFYSAAAGGKPIGSIFTTQQRSSLGWMEREY